MWLTWLFLEDYHEHDLMACCNNALPTTIEIGHGWFLRFSLCCLSIGPIVMNYIINLVLLMVSIVTYSMELCKTIMSYKKNIYKYI